MIEGILSVLEGQPPKVIEKKLLMYIPAKKRQKVMEDIQNAEPAAGREG